MAMPQRDNTIEELKRLDALLEYAVMYGDEAEAERIRAELRRLAETVLGNNDEPQLNGDIEVLKTGNFKTRVRRFHAEFSQNIEDATQTEQGLMYFWAAARTYFKAWMFTKIGKKKTCAELAKEAKHYIALVWGNGEVAARVLEDMKQMANDMIMCHERLDGSEEERRFIEAFSTDDNPKDFRSAICRTMKEFETEKDEPEPTTSATYHVVEC